MTQRLIDANELMKLIPPEEMMSKLAIANAPTVEAIPVKWIEGWLDKFQEKSGYRNMIAPKSITIGDTTIMLPCVPDMLEDWMKENE